MKKIIYKIISRLGYRIEKKTKGKNLDVLKLEKFKVFTNFNLLYNSKRFIYLLNEKYSNLKISDHNNGLLVEFLGLKIFVESQEEFLIINEIFVEQDYNFSSLDQVVVLDIGANIGIASIYFSLLQCVKKIYSFEPVLNTFNQAKYNFELNSQYTHKIFIENFGLGGYERNEQFNYNLNAKGNVGVRGNLSPSYSLEDKNELVDVSIKDVTEQINLILLENKGIKIMIKMDCEGAEYEIFENLSKSGTLNFISIIILEWHDKGSDSIENTLTKFGFEYFSRSLGPISGLIYAYKK